MGNARGLRTRPCPKCNEITPHRTLYARATIEGRRRWLQLFFACTRCHSLNHVHTLVYRLERVSSPLPSALTVAVVRALDQAPLDFNELVTTLKRRKKVYGIGRIFKREVELSLGFLKDRGVVSEEPRDRTEKELQVLRSSTGGRNTCPVDSRKTLVSLYSQTQEGAEHGIRFVPAGTFCLSCGHH